MKTQLDPAGGSQVGGPLPARIILFAAVASLVALATWQLRLPGLYYDELIQVVPALELARGPLASVVGGGPPERQISLFGRAIPFMTMDYMGAVKQFAFFPVAWLVGTTVESIRLFSIATAVGGLLATYAFARQLFGPMTASIGALLLATDPTLVYVARVDSGSSTVMLLLEGMGLWLLARWWMRGRAGALVFGCLFLGLGVYDKANFAWIVAGIGAAILVVAPRGLMGRLSPARLLAAAAGFVLGAWPIVWFNLTWPPPTLAFLSSPIVRDPASGGLLGRLAQRGEMLVNMLGGRYASIWLGDAAPTIAVVPAMVGGATLVILGLCCRRARSSTAAPAAFVLAYGAFVLLSAAVTVGGFAMHHVILTYPSPHLTLAAGLGLAVGEIAKGPGRIGPALGRLVLCLGVLLPLGANVANVVAVSRGLERLGGRGNWSDAIYRLNDVLMTEPERPVAILDWGIHLPLVALSQGRLASHEIFWSLLDPDEPPDLLRHTLARADVRYVLHASGATNFPLPRGRFFAEVERSRRGARLLQDVEARDGQPIFEIYAVDPVADRSLPPP